MILLSFIIKLLPPENGQQKNYSNSGRISLTSIRVDSQASFLDYVKGGYKFHFSIAIDFTESNGW